mmetsp:Transcript_103509/g.333502  ORF Transcript_103509/g.333502 Transcript_103509/m.333502 type:complete len:208 (+) Transcript_103509:1172-1795(+)
MGSPLRARGRPPRRLAPGERSRSGLGSATTRWPRRRMRGSLGWTAPTAVTASATSQRRYLAGATRWSSPTSFRTTCRPTLSIGRFGPGVTWTTGSFANTWRPGWTRASLTTSSLGTTTTTAAGAPSTSGTCTSTSKEQVASLQGCPSASVRRRAPPRRRASDGVPRNAPLAASDRGAGLPPVWPPRTRDRPTHTCSHWEYVPPSKAV